MSTGAASKPVKCLVWDLDDTLWSGILLEDGDVTLNQDVVDVIETLDRRGILHSVASRNAPDVALAKIDELGLGDYFLYPQIGWDAKGESLRRIATELNIGLDAIAFLDDQAFDRDEVQSALPEVRCYSPEDLPTLQDRPEFTPAFVTTESASRRHMYLAEHRRKRAEHEFVGPKEEFLADLRMTFAIAPAGQEDLGRAEELVLRTNQLNTTGITYSLDELRSFAESPDHMLLMASLRDRYGDYGKIGLALVEWGEAAVLKLLLMSCRVMSRGVGTVLLNHVMRTARERGLRLMAELRPNERNRMMLITLRLAGFEEIERRGDLVILESGVTDIPPPPDYLVLRAEPASTRGPKTPSPS